MQAFAKNPGGVKCRGWLILDHHQTAKAGSKFLNRHFCALVSLWFKVFRRCPKLLTWSEPPESLSLERRARCMFGGLSWSSRSICWRGFAKLWRSTSSTAPVAFISRNTADISLRSWCAATVLEPIPGHETGGAEVSYGAYGKPALAVNTKIHACGSTCHIRMKWRCLQFAEDRELALTSSTFAQTSRARNCAAFLFAA